MRPLVAVVAVSVAATACQHGHQHSHEATAPAVARTAPAVQVAAARRFPADASTKAAVARMKALAAAPEASSDDVASLRALGKGVRGELDALITGCTMRGEAHEKLHAWLEPVMIDVATLETGEPPQAVAARDSVRRRIADFQARFEWGFLRGAASLRAEGMLMKSAPLASLADAPHVRISEAAAGA